MIEHGRIRARRPILPLLHPRPAIHRRGSRGAGTVTAVVFLTSFLISPAYGQAPCTPSNDAGEAAHTGASLVNEADRTIVVNRKGERGLDATVSATNHGTVITCGEVHEYVRDDGSPAGRRAHAVNVDSESGDATATNSGLIETHGRGARGLAAESSGGSATAINERGATIRALGDGVQGLFAGIHHSWVSSAEGRAAGAENRGTIGVSGSTLLRIEYDGDGDQQVVFDRIAAGVYAHADTGSATVLNTGDVIATGRNTIGLYAGDSESFDDDGVGYDDDGDGYDDDVVNATVRMTGGSVVAGARDGSGNGWGILVESESGSARVYLSGDSTTVTAHGATIDDPDTGWDEREGTGIIALGDIDCGAPAPAPTPSPTCTSDTRVEISGGATVTADVAVRASGGILNLYESRLNGRVELDSEAGGFNDHFTIRGGSVHGDVNFYGLDDVLTIKNHGYIEGDIDFGDGRDTLVFDVNGTGERTSRIDGAITGIEEMYKRGPGTAWVRDVTFTGSALELEQGGLTLRGHVNLGADGTLTVHDESRLTIEVGDITRDATDHGRITAGGGVIYEGLAAQDSPSLFMQIGADAEANRGAIEARLQQEGTRIDVLGDDTEVMRRADANSQSVAATATLSSVGADGTIQTIGTLSDDGTAVVQLCPEGQVGTPPNCTTPEPAMCPAGQVGTPPNCTTPEPAMCPAGQVGTPPNCTTAPRRDDGDSSNAGAILIGGGAAAALAVYLFDLFDSEEPALVEYDESWTGARATTSFAGVQSGYYQEHRVRTGALEQWTRAFAGGSSALAGGVEGTVRGIAFGWDATLPRGFNVGVSMMPEMAVSARRGPALDIGANVEGGRYGLRGGWRGDSLFLDTSLSHGNYRMHSSMENPAAGGLLAGELDLAQDHAQGRAGMRLDLGGLRATPSVSLFSGSLRQGEHTARGSAMSAEVPGFSQRYAGWRAKLDLAPSGWLDGPGTLNWRPSLHLGTTRTHTSGPGRLDVRQSDHEGVLSFASRAVVKGLPRTVHGIGASLVAARSDAWNFRMGYAGMVVDGEPVHAAVARLMIRF